VTQRHVAIIVVILVLAGLGGAAYSQFKSDTKTDTVVSPTPTPASLQFKGSEAAGQTTQPNQQNQQQMAQNQQRKSYTKFPGVYSAEDLKNKKIVLETSKGMIEFEIFPEAPLASSNFIFLTLEGFYSGLTFHRVEKGFVIQGGDPIGNGTGGPGYRFEDEEVTRSYDKGIVAMANSGPDTNGSQFFIMLEDNKSLPPNYTIFGKVVKGIEIVEKIQVGDKILKASVAPLSNM
jgi:cyclophilin family peptidyl-prolyl cis-trans isomerase